MRVKRKNDVHNNCSLCCHILYCWLKWCVSVGLVFFFVFSLVFSHFIRSTLLRALYNCIQSVLKYIYIWAAVFFSALVCFAFVLSSSIYSYHFVFRFAVSIFTLSLQVGFVQIVAVYIFFSFSLSAVQWVLRSIFLYAVHGSSFFMSISWGEIENVIVWVFACTWIDLKHTHRHMLIKATGSQVFRA